MKTKLITIIFALAVAFAGRATTITVPDDYATVEAALAAAQSGDTVVLMPGTYALASADGITVPSGVTLTGNGVDESETVVTAYRASETDTTSASLLCVSNGTVRNITFKGARSNANSAVPRALAAYDGALVTNCVFSGTTVYSYGFIALATGEGTRITHSTIANTTLSGGNGWTGAYGIRLADNAVLTDSYVTNNTIRTGRAEGLLTLKSGAKMYDTVLRKNSNLGMEVHSGRAPVVIATDGAACVIDGCEISEGYLGNDGGAGANFQGAGGLAVLSAATVRNTKILDNTSADSLGGGVYCSAAATFENVLVAGNKTFTVAYKKPANGCGGMYVNGAATLKHVTVTGNDVELALGGIKTYGAWLNGATAVNSIFWGNRPDVSATSGNVVVSGKAGSATYSLAASVDEFVNASNAASGTECLGGDPLFTDASAGDYTLVSVSPAIDAGSASAGVADDIRGVARPKNDGYEMGCYECEYVADYICALAPLKKTLGPSGGSVTFTASMTMPKKVKTVTWTVTAETGTPPAAQTGNPCTFTFPAGQNVYTVMLEVEWQGGQHATAPADAVVSVIREKEISPGDDLVATLADLTGLSAEDPVTLKLAAGTYTAENSGVAAGADWMFALNTGVILKGAGRGQTILDGGGTNRVLQLAAGSAACDLTVTNAASGGYTAAPRGYGADVAGGTLSNVLFTCGKAWAGDGQAYEDCVYMTSGAITDCEVCGCTYVSSSASRGGIVRLDGGTIRDSKIHHNSFQAQVGNALALVGSSTLAENCDVYNNASGGREYRSHGSAGVALWNGSTIRSSRIYNNYNTGGAGYTYAGGVHVSNGTVESCVITNNTTTGDASGHTGSLAGGVLLGDNATLRNSLVAGNKAPGETNGSGAGGVLMVSASARVESCTIADNTAKLASKAGVYATAGRLYNSIVWDNAFSNLNAAVTNCCTPVLSAGAGNISADPKFKPGRYGFSSDSPCRNAGTNEDWMATATDVAGTTRILEDVVDIGCYEYDRWAVAECSLSIAGDYLPDDGALRATAFADPLDDLYAYVLTVSKTGGATETVTNLGVSATTFVKPLPACGTYTVSLKVLWGTAEEIVFELTAPETYTVAVWPRTVNVAIGGTTFTEALAQVYRNADDPGIVQFAAGTYTAENAGVAAESDWMFTVESGVMLKGAGVDATILDAGGTNRVLKLLSGAWARDFTITNAASKGTTSSLLGYGADVRGGTLANVLVTQGRAWTVSNGATEETLYLNGGTVTNCEICGTQCDFAQYNNRGGVVYVASGLVVDTKIHGNRSYDRNATSLTLASATAVAENCDIFGNTSGGLEYRTDGTAGVNLRNGAKIRRSRIFNNFNNGGCGNQYSGGLCCCYDSGLAENCVITNNSTSYNSNLTGDVAGGVLAYAALTLRNCLVADNKLTNGKSGKPIAGGVRLAASGAKMENCTVKDNVLSANPAFAGVYATAGTIRNTIVWGNACSNTAATVTYSCTPELFAGTGNIATDPKFRYGSIALKGTSPCRDTGETLVWMTNSVPAATDLLGNERIINGAPDMGCLEMSRAPGFTLLVK